MEIEIGSYWIPCDSKGDLNKKVSISNYSNIFNNIELESVVYVDIFGVYHVSTTTDFLQQYKQARPPIFEYKYSYTYTKSCIRTTAAYYRDDEEFEIHYYTKCYQRLDFTKQERV